MSACFAIIGSIASTTRERKLNGTLSLKRKKLPRRVVDLKITLILQKGRFLLRLFCKRVLIARDKLPRYGRVIDNSFLSTVNATGVCKNFLFKNVLMQLSTSLMGNAFFLKMSFKWRHLNIRVGEHSGVSPLTGKKSKTKKTTAIKDHMLFCDHVVSLEDFKILASSNSEFHLKIKESLLISRDKPELNRNEKSLPLYLFD